MKIDIKALEIGPSTVDIQLQADALDDTIASLAGPGNVGLVIYNNKTELVFEALVKATVNLECSRCLKTFKHNIETRFHFTARQGAAKPGDEEDENLIFFTQSDTEIDIGKLIAEEIGVNLPMKPVCKNSCKGFCPLCGANLNSGKCACVPQAAHPAWEALRKLKTE